MPKIVKFGGSLA